MKPGILSFIVCLFFSLTGFSQDNNIEKNEIKHRSRIDKINLEQKSSLIPGNNRNLSHRLEQFSEIEKKSVIMKKINGDFLTGYTILNWNTSEWINDIQYIPTYD